MSPGPSWIGCFQRLCFPVVPGSGDALTKHGEVQDVGSDIKGFDGHRWEGTAGT